MGREFLYGQRSVAKVSRAPTRTRQAEQRQGCSPYAFGLQVGAYRGMPMVEHGGSTGGYRTDLARFPPQHTSVATMCNVSNADAGTLAHRVADVVLGNRFAQPAATSPVRAGAQQAGTPVTLDAAGLKPFVGRYYSDELSSRYELSVSGLRSSCAVGEWDRTRCGQSTAGRSAPVG